MRIISNNRMMLQHCTVIILRFCKRWEMLPSEWLSQIVIFRQTQPHFVFRNDYIFWSKRPSSGDHYKNFKIRYNTVQIMLVIWDAILLTKVIQYKIYIRLYKNRIDNVLASEILSKLCIKMSNIVRKIAKIVEIRLSVSQGLLCGVICS